MSLFTRSQDIRDSARQAHPIRKGAWRQILQERGKPLHAAAEHWDGGTTFPAAQDRGPPLAVTTHQLKAWALPFLQALRVRDYFLC